MLVLAIPTFIPFFRNGFFTCSCRFFFVDISYEVSAWTESQEDDETTLQVYNFLIWQSEVFQTEEKSRHKLLLRPLASLQLYIQ